MNKSLVIIAVILAVALSVLAAFVFVFKTNPFSSLNSPTQVSQTENKPLNITKKDIDNGGIPNGLPKNLPVEAGSTTLQSYEAVTRDGRKQSTVIFTSKKTLLKDMVLPYEEFFVSEGWEKVPSAGEVSGSMAVLFKKDANVVVVTARSDSKSKDKSVEVTLTSSAK